VIGTYQPERGTGQLGRIALLPAYRGRGWGGRLVEVLLGHARALGLTRLVLDAQTQSVAFYERFGFAPEGPEFDDAGIPHRRMRLVRRWIDP
jgi:predicted GNAT family N-acyltransferase